jgi:hypothetical protein
VCIDDLTIASKKPNEITNALTDKHKFKLNGAGPISASQMRFLLRRRGSLVFGPRKYVDTRIDAYERIFGSNPKIPLDKGDHPGEIDTSELLDAIGTQQHQLLVGQLQWAMSLGRLGIMSAVTTLSVFHAAPRREGHLERAKQQVCGHLSKMRHAIIRICTNEPDYSAMPDPHHNWSFSVCKGAKEGMPEDAQMLVGNFRATASCLDANLHDCMIAGKSVTGYLHLLNKTPID